MVAGPFLVDKHKKEQTPAPVLSSEATGPRVAAIRSTSFFDSVSPHLSRRQPYKSMPVPVASDVGPSPSSDHGDGPPSGGSRGYRGPPPGYSGHYSPYGYPPYGGPPPHGYHPHHGGPPPPGYPHHLPHSHSHPPPPGGPGGYSPGYGGRPMYGGHYGAYEGSGAGSPSNVGDPRYPQQHSRDGRSKTPPFQRAGARGTTPGSAASVRSASSGPRSSPISRRENKSSPELAQPQPETPGGPRTSPTIADECETERLRQAALTEISPSQVDPIKTAFHFFVTDMRDSLRSLAEAEVRKYTGGDGALDPYLVNSNLNCRLMKAWEDLNDEERQACMSKEEADRRRFMEEEEIASRHCATLTARSKSPKTPERRSSSSLSNNLNGSGSGEHSSRRSPNPSPTASLTASTHGNVPPPSPIARLTKIASMDQDEKKMDDTASTGGDPDEMTTITTQKVSHAPPDKYLDVHHSHDEIDILDASCDIEGTNKRPSPTKIDGKAPPKRNRLGDVAEGSANITDESLPVTEKTGDSS